LAAGAGSAQLVAMLAAGRMTSTQYNVIHIQCYTRIRIAAGEVSNIQCYTRIRIISYSALWVLGVERDPRVVINCTFIDAEKHYSLNGTIIFPYFYAHILYIFYAHNILP